MQQAEHILTNFYKNMKKLFAFLTLSLAVALCACDNDENPSWNVPQPVVESLFDMYPTAQNVSWYHSGIYSVARFSTTQNGAAQYRWAWFDNAGTWYMTETNVALAQMPQAVQNAFAETTYASWKFKDGDWLERAGLTDIYVIEVEGSGNNSKTVAALYYTPNGSLFKTVFNPAPDYRYTELLPAPLPAQVSAYIQAEYPAAQLINSFFGDNLARVEILDEGVLRTLWFDGNNNWLYTVTQIEQEDLPETVQTAFQESAYAAYTIQDAFYYNTPSGNYYRLALQSGTQTVEVDITPDGELTVVNN